MEYEFLKKHIVYEYLNPPAQMTLAPLVLGYERCTSTKSVIGPTTRNRYIMHYVFEGKGTLRLGGKTYCIGKNTLTFLPMEEIVYAPDPEDPWAYLWIEFTGQQASSLIASAGLSAQSPVFVPNDPAQMFTLFGDMVEGIRLAENRNFYYLSVAANLMKIFYYILCQKNRTEETSDKEGVKIQPAIHYIDEHYADPDFSIRNVCDLFYWSPNYFARAFKKVMNISPMRYVTQLRMRKAQMMLESKKFKISTIAYACGYSSPYYFSLEFKRLMGTPPSHYLAASTE